MAAIATAILAANHEIKSLRQAAAKADENGNSVAAMATALGDANHEIKSDRLAAQQQMKIIMLWQQLLRHY